MPAASTIERNKQQSTAKPGVPNEEDIDTSTSVPSAEWMQEEIARLQAENLRLSGEAKNPGQRFKEEWVRDPDVPDKIMDGDFHDISQPPQGVPSQRLRAPGTFDPLAVSDQLARRMGINLATHEPVWRRKDNWQGLGVNDVEEFMDHNEGGEVCYSSDKKMHHRGDNVLCKRLRKYGSELVNQRITEAHKRDAETYPKSDRGGMTEEMQIQIREENRDAIKGILANSRTHGMSLERAGQIHTVEEIQREKARYLYAGRTAPAKATVDNAADRVSETLKASVKGKGGTYGVNIGFDPVTGRRIA